MANQDNYVELPRSFSSMRGAALQSLTYDEAKRFNNFYMPLREDLEKVFNKLAQQQWNDLRVAGRATRLEVGELERDTSILTVAIYLDHPRMFYEMAGSRPLFGWLSCDLHPELFQKKFAQFAQDPCPWCLTTRVQEPLDTPMNSDIPTRCNHWLCQSCWRVLANSSEVARCPISRDDITEWAKRYLDDELSDDNDDEL